ncbi:MAG: ribosomal protein S18-alanine N-acetyltransferase [Clostridia bacterium]|nr:ribosomal protein S18-alanine N-acetyltransferase [Clostridia bacterium]
MKKIVIDPTIPQDFPDICRIEKECFSDPWSEASLRSAALNPRFVSFTALYGGKIAGYAFMFTIADECDILNIAVAEKARRLGIGAALLSALLEKAKERGSRNAYLEVRGSNTPAITLYEKFGFSPYGSRKGYYKDPPEDAVLMKKFLYPDEDENDNTCN